MKKEQSDQKDLLCAIMHLRIIGITWKEWLVLLGKSVSKKEPNMRLTLSWHCVIKIFQVTLWI